MYDIFSLPEFKMPDGFLWGSGYAGHQVEGNNVNSNQWYEEQLGQREEVSGLACNSYEMYKTDIDLAEKLGMRAFRTSVEWSRIEPSEGNFDEEAAEHYVKFFAGLKEKGIKVFATMFHFSYPIWFMKKGNFMKEENFKYFSRYLEYIVPKIAPYVDYWNVMNEINLGTEEERVTYKLNCLKCHANGYHIIKKYSDAPVGTAHALVDYKPYRPCDEFDKVMTDLQNFRNHEFFFHAIRTGEIVYPDRDAEFYKDLKGASDFWSINFYTRDMIDSRKARLNGDKFEHKQLNMIDRKFYLNEMYPECALNIFGKLHDKPIIITENGCSCNDDRFRIIYLSLYLSAISEAIKQGADIRGYLYWSIMDNYEWGSYAPKFGLCECDRTTFERTPKPSAWFYKEIMENNGLNQEIIRKYIDCNPSLVQF